MTYRIESKDPFSLTWACRSQLVGTGGEENKTLHGESLHKHSHKHWVSCCQAQTNKQTTYFNNCACFYDTMMVLHNKLITTFIHTAVSLVSLAQPTLMVLGWWHNQKNPAKGLKWKKKKTRYINIPVLVASGFVMLMYLAVEGASCLLILAFTVVKWNHITDLQSNIRHNALCIAVCVSGQLLPLTVKRYSGQVRSKSNLAFSFLCSGETGKFLYVVFLTVFTLIAVWKAVFLWHCWVFERGT